MFKNKQIFIQGQFLHAGIVGKKLKLVAMFATLQMECSHKIFYSNKKTIDRIAKICGFKATRAYTLIRECVEWGIIIELNDHRGGHRLLSNLELSEKFGGSKFTKSYLTHEVLNMGIKAAVIVLRQIPAFSCAKSQQIGFKKNHNNTSNNDASIGSFVNGEFVYTIKGHKLLQKAKAKGYDKITSDPVVSISNKKGSQLSGKSKPTFIKDKYFLETIGVWCVKRRYGILQEAVSMAEWLIIKNDLVGHGFPAFAKYNPFTQTVYRDLACEIITKKHA